MAHTKTVLVAYASKYGSTKEIAEAIAGTLLEENQTVDIKNVSHVKTLKPYDVIVLGSAVYAGNWRPSAKKFVDTFSKELRTKQVWLFSSGPVGEPLKPAGNTSVDISAIQARVIPKDHKIFAGKLDKKKLNFGEKAMLAAVRAKPGDYRDWNDINTWAKKIANSKN